MDYNPLAEMRIPESILITHTHGEEGVFSKNGMSTNKCGRNNENSKLLFCNQSHHSNS